MIGMLAWLEQNENILLFGIVFYTIYAWIYILCNRAAIKFLYLMKIKSNLCHNSYKFRETSETKSTFYGV